MTVSIHRNSTAIQSDGSVNTSEEEKRDKYLQVRVSESERERVKQQAKNHGYEYYSEFIRDLVFGRIDNVSTPTTANDSHVNTRNWAKGFKIFAQIFNGAMKKPEIKQYLVKKLSKNGKPSKDFAFIMKLMKRLEEGK